MTYTLFGIKNCDTVKKACKWLDENGIVFEFHDYKTAGADADVLRRGFEIHGWDKIINRRSTTWRKLPKAAQDNMDEESALQTALDNPSLIKRPLLVSDNLFLVGFDTETWKSLPKS